MKKLLLLFLFTSLLTISCNKDEVEEGVQQKTETKNMFDQKEEEPSLKTDLSQDKEITEFSMPEKSSPKYWDVDKMLQRHFEAIGQEKLNKKKTLIKKFITRDANGEQEYNTQQMRPRYYRNEMIRNGQKFISAFDGKNAWSINPASGSIKPRDIIGEPARRLKESADFDGLIFTAVKKGYKMIPDGLVELNGRQNFKMILIVDEKLYTEYYIDKASYLVTMIQTLVYVQGKETFIQNYFKNYKDFDGIKMAMKVEMYLNDQIASETEVTELKFDEEIKKIIFYKPEY